MSKVVSGVLNDDGEWMLDIPSYSIELNIVHSSISLPSAGWYTVQD